MHSIAIIGGGLSGTLVALQLMRQSNQPLRINLINHLLPVHRGIAYSTPEMHHLLNVRACNMSALPERPDHFVKWLSNHPAYAWRSWDELTQLFVPRKLYGDYLEEIFQTAQYKFEQFENGKVAIVSKEAITVKKADVGYAVCFSDGNFIYADHMVLATGHRLPSWPEEFREVQDHPRCISNPWKTFPGHLLAGIEEDALIIGTGLSMADTFLSLEEAGWKGTVYALSRNGLIPQRHTVLHSSHNGYHPDHSAHNLQSALSIFRTLTERHEHSETTDASAINELRPVAQQLWKRFSSKDKNRFLHFFKSGWNAARHRLPSSVYEKLDAAFAQRRLKLLKGKVAEVEADKDYFILKMITDGETRYIVVKYLINCSGPEEHLRSDHSSLWEELLRQSLVRPDAINMGPEVNDLLQVINGSGETDPSCYALGPLVKGTCWECTTVPEIRDQAKSIAATMLQKVSGIKPERVMEVMV